MAKRINGILKWIIALTGIAVMIGGWVWIASAKSSQINQNCRDITAIKPEVEKNSEHRLQDERDTEYIKKRMDSIETMQSEILREVRRR